MADGVARVTDSFPAIFSRHAAAYARAQDQILAARASPSREAALAWVKARPGMTILDLGCGPGTLSLPLARALEGRGEVIGVDLAEGMLEVARRRTGNLPVRFLRMDAAALQFPAAHFDAAVCGHSLQFLPQSERVLRDVHRVLKPQGRFAASIPFRTEPHPALEAIVAALDSELGPAPPEPPRAELVRDPARLQRALLGAGFRFAQVEPTTAIEEIGEDFAGRELEWWGNARRLESASADARGRIAARAAAGVANAMASNPGPILITELVVKATA